MSILNRPLLGNGLLTDGCSIVDARLNDNECVRKPESRNSPIPDNGSVSVPVTTDTQIIRDEPFNGVLCFRSTPSYKRTWNSFAGSKPVYQMYIFSLISLTPVYQFNIFGPARLARWGPSCAAREPRPLEVTGSPWQRSSIRPFKWLDCRCSRSN
jgi:hypothetical protein